MTAPAGAVTAADGSRRYVVQGFEMPSANTVLSALDKPGLNIWKLKRVARHLALDERARQRAIDGHEYGAAMDALEGDSPESALGTAVHMATETWDRGGVREACLYKAMAADTSKLVDRDDVAAHLEQWIQAREDYGIELTLIESTVVNMDMKYAGTPDRFATISYPDVRETLHPGCDLAHVLDVKTGAKVWPDVALQMAAYANATHEWDPHEDRIKPLLTVCREIGIVASLHADSCTIVPVRLELAYSAFAAATLVWRWSAEDSKRALLPKLELQQGSLPW